MQTRYSIASIVLLVTMLLSSGEPAARAEAPQAKTSTVEIAAPALEFSSEKIEQRILELLSAGQQSEAESFLAEQLAGMTESLELTELLSKTQNIQAGRYFVAHREALLEQQRALFLTAALTRSRFDKQGALVLFNTVYAIDPDTAAGQCALCMMKLDTMQHTELAFFPVGQAFMEFRKVVAAHPDDVIVRWMLAVQCRTWNQNAEGARLYGEILEQWNPGPALVHQTYANLLDELQRYDEALRHRYITVRMEPASWSFDGLGNTLDSLERYQEGCAAHWIAVTLNPYSPGHWVNWGYSLCGNQQYDAAIAKCQRALELKPNHFRAFWVWGKSLAGKGDLQGALAKYDQAIAIYPGESNMKQEAAELRAKLKEEQSSVVE